jgi:hypothetical protein
MTSVTYGMRKSSCKVMFDMHQGALGSFETLLCSSLTGCEVPVKLGGFIKNMFKRNRVNSV